MATGHLLSFKRVHQQRQWQEVRRTEALERQRAQRLVSIEHARRLGDHDQAVEDVMLEVGWCSSDYDYSPVATVREGMHMQENWSMGSSGRGAADAACATDSAQTGLVNRRSDAKAHQSGRDYLASQLMQHEWLTDIPEDLGQNWCACLRAHNDNRAHRHYHMCHQRVADHLPGCKMYVVQDCHAASGRPKMLDHSFKESHSELLQEGRDHTSFSVSASWWLSPNRQALPPMVCHKFWHRVARDVIQPQGQLDICMWHFHLI